MFLEGEFSKSKAREDLIIKTVLSKIPDQVREQVRKELKANLLQEDSSA